MKQEIKKLFAMSRHSSVKNQRRFIVSPLHRFTPSPLHREKGFTLVELAMVLVVLGILVAIGVGLIGPLTKRAKLQETREVVSQAKETITGYAVKNGSLPGNLESAGARRLDAWGNDLSYYYFSSAGDICGVNNTGWLLRECTNDDCTTYNEKQNIAFIVYSKGEDGDGACTGTSTPFYVKKQGMGYNNNPASCTYSPINSQFNYDDIVAYASLDEIRSLRGCPQPLAVTSPSTLPTGEEDSFYSYLMEAIGGRPPYTWSGSAGSGLSLDPSGLISGTVNVNNTPPNTGELTACSASIPVSATVNDSAGSPPVNYSGTIPVRPKPLKIITETIPSGREGSPYSATIIASGGRTPYSWSMLVSPLCPAGLTCSGNTISGTPASGTAGTYNVTSQVNDTCTTNTRNFVLTINPSGGGGGGCTPLSLTPPSGTSWSATVGTPFTQSITVTGGQTPYTNTQCTPASCNGLNLSCSSSGATISGTPTSSGTCTFNVSWQDSCTNPGPQTISGTYTVNISGGAPTCTLSASPGIVRYGGSSTLTWTITNGPANATFSPSSGTCTSFPNSTGGSCTTGALTAPPCQRPFTLTVSNAFGTNSCSTTLFVGRQSYRVWNNTGATSDFLVDGTCRNNIGNNVEITTGTLLLNPGETINRYLSAGICSSTVQGTLTYDQAMNADSPGDCDGRVNFTGTDR